MMAVNIGAGAMAERGLFSRAGNLYRFARAEGLLAAAALVKRKMSASPADDAVTAAALIDADALARDTPIDHHIARADHYFSWMDDRSPILKKPFNHAGEAAETLLGLSLLLRFADLFPGARVMDFGAGSCWLSRDLALLGCDVTAVDISRNALDLGRRFNDKHPFADEMTIDYHCFDGVNLGLPDGYFDTIVCFASFHHVADQDQVLRHFHRLLQPGGIAAFIEPGPVHSRQPQSQLEMRNYGVLERDIDVHRIWRTAEALGFSDIKLARYMPDPSLLGLAEFDAMLAGRSPVDLGPSYFNSRPFFLTKAGERRLDSRFGRGLVARISAENLGPSADGVRLAVRLDNIGSAVWLPSQRAKGGVCISSKLLDQDHRVLEAHYANWWVIDREVAPGESFSAEVTLTIAPAAGHFLSIGLVADRVAHFDGPGNLPCIVGF
jgi:2-polyprenyl-3-methyl-5-hydroxy-6-metoxy-1,4-benzoquinol methylase